MLQKIKKVYVVDDDEAVRKSLARSLIHLGYHVEVYSSGKIFLDNLSEHEYGCVVLDIAMPGMSGLEVQSELMKRACPIPIIFTTGHADMATSVRVIGSGSIELIEKPYPLEILLERIEKVLKQEELRRTPG